MDYIRDIKEENVRQLATTLRQSGLAASETEAIRMAKNMSNTGSKVNKNFEDKRDSNIMGLSHLNKKPLTQEKNPMMQKFQEVDIPKTAEEIIEAQRQKVEEMQTPKKETEFSNITVNQAVQEPVNKKQILTEIESQEGNNLKIDGDEEIIVQDIIKTEPLQETVSEVESVVEPDESKKQVVEQTQEESFNEMAEESVQKKEEEPVQEKESSDVIERKKPKKNISEMAESKVDLSSVFNFNN